VAIRYRSHVLPEIVNHTLGKHYPFVVRDKTGRDHYVVPVKFTAHFAREGAYELLDDGPFPYIVDECNGDEGKGSIRKPSDLYEFKPGTDVLLVGHAHAPFLRQITSVDVTLRVGPIRKTVRAFGVRAWRRATFGGLSPGSPRPIQEPVPLVYELAWGGMDLSDPSRPIGEPRNYLGRGVVRDPAAHVDHPAVQLEDTSGSRAPACFGAIHRHWQPRMQYAGTFDDAWLENKSPLLPDDFDPRYHVSVPHDQWSTTPLHVDEPIEIENATEDGIFRAQMPRITPRFFATVEGNRKEYATHLDTLLVDTDKRTVEATFRVSIPIPRKLQLIEEIEIEEGGGR
jgi:hypothetical protein